MISQYFNYQKNGKQFKIKEISFNEFKIVNKRLLNEELKEINTVFEELCDSVVTGKNLNCLEKFYCLMILRTMIHGNDFSFKNNDVVINININTLLDKLNLNFEDIVFEYEKKKYYFNLPKNFYHETALDLIIDCLVGIEIKNNKWDCSEITYKKYKIDILQEISLPLATVYKLLDEKFQTYSFEFYKEFVFKITDGSLLMLLRRLFYLDMSSLYDFEYSCIRSLNLGVTDMSVYTLPELRIFLQLLTKELKSKQGSNNELNS
jgi:hypothetical protein